MKCEICNNENGIRVACKRCRKLVCNDCWSVGHNSSVCRCCEPNRWLLVGVNCHTGKREIIAASAMRETAINHKIDLQNQKPLRYAGVTVEYGKESEYQSA